MTHKYVSKLTIIGSANDLSPGRRQAIIWTNAVILLTAPQGTNFNELLTEIHTLPFKKIHLKISSGEWRPFCLGLNVLSKPAGYGLKRSIPDHNKTQNVFISFGICCAVFLFMALVRYLLMGKQGDNLWRKRLYKQRIWDWLGHI